MMRKKRKKYYMSTKKYMLFLLFIIVCIYYYTRVENFVDYETERHLLREIQKLLKPMNNIQTLAGSLLIVSHRVTSMEHVDLILVLDEGQIVDRGQHSDLIQRPGYYQQMWALQNDHNT